MGTAADVVALSEAGSLMKHNFGVHPYGYVHLVCVPVFVGTVC